MMGLLLHFSVKLRQVPATQSFYWHLNLIIYCSILSITIGTDATANGGGCDGKRGLPEVSKNTLLVSA